MYFYALGDGWRLIAAWATRTGVVVLRGNLRWIRVPVHWFRPNCADPVFPDFEDIEVIDWGNTLRLGRYQASVDALLYDFDPHYRAEADARRA